MVDFILKYFVVLFYFDPSGETPNIFMNLSFPLPGIHLQMPHLKGEAIEQMLMTVYQRYCGFVLVFICVYADDCLSEILRVSISVYMCVC